MCRQCIRQNDFVDVVKESETILTTQDLYSHRKPKKTSNPRFAEGARSKMP
jgi:hypothetical protein